MILGNLNKQLCTVLNNFDIFAPFLRDGLFFLDFYFTHCWCFNNIVPIKIIEVHMEKRYDNYELPIYCGVA